MDTETVSTRLGQEDVLLSPGELPGGLLHTREAHATGPSLSHISSLANRDSFIPAARQTAGWQGDPNYSNLNIGFENLDFVMNTPELRISTGVSPQNTISSPTHSSLGPTVQLMDLNELDCVIKEANSTSGIGPKVCEEPLPISGPSLPTTYVPLERIVPKHYCRKVSCSASFVELRQLR